MGHPVVLIQERKCYKFFTAVELIAGCQRRRREVAQQLEEQTAGLSRLGGGAGGTRRDWQLRQRQQRRQRREPGSRLMGK